MKHEQLLEKEYSKLNPTISETKEEATKKFADVVGEKPNTVSNWFGRKDGIGDAVIDKIYSQLFPM